MENKNNPMPRTAIAFLIALGILMPVCFIGIVYFISADIFIALAPVLFLLFAIVEIIFVCIFAALYANSKGKSTWIWSIAALGIVFGILITFF